MKKSLARANPNDVCIKTPDGELGYEALSQVQYDNRKLKEVVETLFGKIKGLEETLENVIVDRDKFRNDFKIKYDKLNDEHDRMLLDVKDLSTFTLD